MLLVAAHSFLVVVDVQERLAPAVTAGDETIGRCALLMKAARRLEVPILLSEQYPKGLGPTVPALAELAPEGATVPKLHFSCTEEPKFADRLEDLRRDHAVICGMEAHVCVLQTALGLSDRGYAVIVVEDAVSSRKPSDKAAALRRLERAGVSIVTAEMVVFEWLGQAGTPEFKELAQLIR